MFTPGPGAEARIGAWRGLLGPEEALLCDARWESLLGQWRQMLCADAAAADETDWDTLGRQIGERGDRFAGWLECQPLALIGLLDAALAREGVRL